MPLTNLQPTDSWYNWYTKTNDLITTINNLGASSSVVSTTSPSAGQILVFNGTVFRNVTVSGDISIDQNGVVTVTGGLTGAGSRGRRYYYARVSNLQ